jgi:hypothetical protein
LSKNKKMRKKCSRTLSMKKPWLLKRLKLLVNSGNKKLKPRKEPKKPRLSASKGKKGKKLNSKQDKRLKLGTLRYKRKNVESYKLRSKKSDKSERLRRQRRCDLQLRHLSSSAKNTNEKRWNGSKLRRSQGRSPLRRPRKPDSKP